MASTIINNQDVSPQSELNHLIPPEIRGDEFYRLIQELARTERVSNVLEIGSSAGDGSTEAFVKGLSGNPHGTPRLFCVEVSNPRYTELARRYADKPFVHCYNTSSIPIERFPSEQDIETFYHTKKTALSSYTLERVLGWLKQDIDYVRSAGLNEDGIERIKRENNIDCFDMVLIDGSEFTGKSELDKVYGARVILLDDINGFKNFDNYQRLVADKNYQLIAENWKLRNGYAVFRRITDFFPIHFFTIVLNGEPFIRHHIKVFSKLPFEWHWHIVEGVADLKHDTGWSLQFGGKITDELHHNGLSKDGTTEYLNDLAKQFPSNITIYRLPNGGFWDGKLQMVNAPLANIRTKCLLWQVDADELWTTENIIATRKIFLRNPEKSAAYFYCHYFVGPRKFVTSFNTWATYQKDWIRVWNFRVGMQWAAHEPPILIDNLGRNVGEHASFSRDETMSQGITFQHFAYTTEAQVKFKEIYYGYTNSVLHWQRLQKTSGPVRASEYLPWANDDAIIDDWSDVNGLLLSETIFSKQHHPKAYVSMSVEQATHFEGELRKLFIKLRPSTIIETGTYLGRGTSSIIYRAIRDFSIDADFSTIEVNPSYHAEAKRYFKQQGMRIVAELGLSVPRNMLLSTMQIKDKFIKQKEYENIYYDHSENERAHLYFSETDYNVPDKLLYKTMERYNFKPSFVLLDSAGHLGFTEFEYFLSLVRGDCYLMLDDIYHCKHYKTLQFMKADPRFEIIVESPEKFGFCIAKYSHVRSILFLRPDSIGDNLLAASMLPHIKSKYPHAKVSVLCQNHIAELYETSPFVDEVIGFDRLRGYQDEKYRSSIINRLQELHFDLGLNTLYSREPLYDLFAINSGARTSIAFNGNLCNIAADVRDQNNKLYTKIIQSHDEHKTELERHREFLAAIGILAPPLKPMVWLTSDDEEYADAFFKINGLISEKTVALFPCGQWTGKYYEHYGSTLSKIFKDNEMNVVAFGTATEFETNQKNIDNFGLNGINLSGKTTLRQTAAILKRCCLGIGADTGTAHIACAVGTPNVVILGGGHFGRFFPYSHLSSIVCLPLGCYNCNWKCIYDRVHCIKDINPKVLDEAVRQTLGNRSEIPRIFIQGSSLWDSNPERPQWGSFHNYINMSKVEIITTGDTDPTISSIWEKIKRMTRPAQNNFFKTAVDELIQHGENQFSKNDFKGAELAFSSALEMKPNDAVALNNLGVLYYMTGDKEKAFKHYEAAVINQPDNVTFLKNLADFYFVELNQTDNAIQTYIQVIKRNPRDLESLLILGDICSALKLHETAKIYYSKALEIEPNNSIARQGIDTLQEFEEQARIKCSESVTIRKYTVIPKISVITPSYNQAQFIEKTINSVLSQKYPNFEHIVIDGGSTDSTVEILKKYPHLIWKSEKDRGQSNALNKGFKVATGNIIAWINSDDWYEADIFSVIANWFVENPGKNIVMGDCNLFDENDIRFDKVINTERGFNELKQYWVPRSIPTQPAIFFRKKLLNEFGYLDENLHYAMDYDLWMRFAQKYFFYHIDVTIANYRFHPSAKGGDQNWSNFVPEWTKVYQRYVSKKSIIPIVSVVIPCFNYGQYLKEAVESVIKQTYQYFEIIIINDGSTDNSKKIAEKLISQYRSYNIRLLNQENSGQPAIARNKGIERASGEYILPLDADDVIEPSMIEECLDVLEKNQSVSIAYTDRKDFDGVSQLVLAGDYDFKKLRYANQISYCALYRKKIWREVGGYRTNVKGMEDWDFWVAAGSRGFTGQRIPKPLFKYRRHDTGVYQEALREFNQKFAQIVLNNPEVYPQKDVDFADAALKKNKDQVPEISVIVPTFNRPEMLSIAIESIRKQTVQNIEICIVNDGGSDVSALIDACQDFRIRYMTHLENRGLSAARNTGIRNAKGRYIALLDDDDCFYKDHLETALEALRSGWKVIYTDAVRAEYTRVGDDYELRRKHVPYSIDFDRSKLLIGNIAPVNCFVFEREMAIKAGLFDETFSVLEDWEFWLRLSALTPFHHLKKQTVQVNWRVDGTTMTSSRQAEFKTNRSRIYQRYQAEIAQIPDRDSIVQELNAIWSQDKQGNMDGVPEPASHSGTVSIIILTLNQHKYTKECVESIQKHTPEPHEIIFIDNGSGDGTVKWLRKLAKNNSNYKLVENKKNLGFSKGCNQGIEAATGEFILLLNNDVVVTENWLDGMLECLTSAPHIGIVGPMTNCISGPQKVPDVGYSSIDDLVAYAEKFREKNLHRRINNRRIVGFCMLFRRKLIDEIGLLDESFGSGNFEDDDFCLRAMLAGYRNIIAGDVFIHHYGSKTFIGNGIDYGSSLNGNRRIFIEKWGGEEVAHCFGGKLIVENAAAKADELFGKGDIEKATACILGALKQAPYERSLYLKIAEMLIDVKRYQDAVGILDALHQNDSDPMQPALLGYCEEALGNNEKAREYAERALAIDPRAALPMNVMGVLAFKKGEHDVAEGLFSKAIEFDPSFGESCTNLGSLKWAAGEHTEALNHFERGFILSPTVGDVVTAYHSAVAETKSFARAEPVFREAKALHPNDRRIAFLMIAVLIKQEKHELAMQDIENAMMQFGIDDGILSAALEIRAKTGPLKIRPGITRRSLSVCMIVKNEELNLAKCLMSVKPVSDEIIVVDTGSTDKTKALALALGARVFDFPWTNDFSEARNYSLSKASGDWILVLDADEVVSPLDHDKLKKLMKNPVGKRVAYTMITRNYTNQPGSKGWTANEGTYFSEEAGKGWVPSPKVRLFANDKRVRFVNPVHELVEPTLQKNRIKIKVCDVPVHHYGRLNQDKVITKGKEYYRLGIAKVEKTKGDYYALKELAIQASEIGEYEEAVNIWQKVIELNSDDASDFMDLGFAHLKLKQYDKAAIYSKMAMGLNPDLREAALNYSAAELIAGDVRIAISTLESILKKHIDYPPAMGRLAAAFLVSGRKEEGFRYLDRLTAAGFDCTNMLEEQSLAFFSEGKIQPAFFLLQAAIEKGIPSDSIHALLAECQQKMMRNNTVSEANDFSCVLTVQQDRLERLNSAW